LSAGISFEGSALEAAWGIWSSKIRFVGVGTMMVGGAVSIINARQGLSHALKEIFSKSAQKVSSSSHQERDISPRIILLCSILCICCLGYVFFEVTKSIPVTIIAAIVMLILAFFFTSVANYIVAIVGSSNSPVSGMNIAAVLVTGLLLVLLGYTGIEGMVATLGVAAVICSVTCMAGDSCNELKMGHMIGAAPYRQQIMLIAGMTASAFLVGPILQLLHSNTWHLILLGAGIGFLILVFNFILETKQTHFRMPVMPVAVGIYLPAPLTLPILTGSIIAWLVSYNKNHKTNEEHLQRGILFSSGFIAGESITGVFIALLASLGITRLNLSLSSDIQMLFSCLGALTLIIIFIWGTRANKTK
jgi:uncharacterized oligopeptide transporter (OPT) family protein